MHHYVVETEPGGPGLEAKLRAAEMSIENHNQGAATSSINGGAHTAAGGANSSVHYVRSALYQDP